jgi:hypothetical protein
MANGKWQKATVKAIRRLLPFASFHLPWTDESTPMK